MTEPTRRMLADDARCPCLSGEVYAACCGRFHRGEEFAPTAERLMRSRFSAFAVSDVGYLLGSWHPSTRPGDLELDPAQSWRRLDILHTSGGGMLEKEGVVEFRAFYRVDGRPGSVHETSRFVREGRRWYYLDGVVDPRD